MSTLISLSGSLDDIIFEGRNKAYGAYELRQLYEQHLRRALMITLALCLLLLMTPLAMQYFAKPIAIKPIVDGTSNPTLVTLTDPVLPKEPVTKAAAAPAAVVVPPHAAIATHVVPDPEVKATVTKPDLPPNVGVSDPNAGTDPNASGSSVGVKNGTGTAVDSATPAPAAPAVAAAPLSYAEVMPSFAGGQDALRAYLQKHVRYPGPALANQIAGKVFVSFVVQADGNVTDVQVVKGLGYGTEEAAARAVREMPSWSPGMQNHHAVAVRFVLPITFQYQ